MICEWVNKSQKTKKLKSLMATLSFWVGLIYKPVMCYKRERKKKVEIFPLKLVCEWFWSQGRDFIDGRISI